MSRCLERILRLTSQVDTGPVLAETTIPIEECDTLESLQIKACGGYNFPDKNRRYFLRRGHPADLLELAMVMDGYTGFRDCLSGNAWGLKTNRLSPY